MFTNFSSFTNAPAVLTKKTGRDTNLTGNGARGLPKNHVLFWYEWRAIPRSGDANLSTNANRNITEEWHRLLQLASVSFNFTQTTLIETQLTELPAGVGPAWGQTTHNAAVMFGPNCVPNRKGKVITITGKPVMIGELQDFDVEIKVPEAGFTPTEDIFLTVFLEGLLVRGIFG